jgi:diguanylate cyclase (GGDEF)-like protein
MQTMPIASYIKTFDAYIKDPLEASDPQTVLRIKQILLEDPTAKQTPLSCIVKRLSGRTFNEPEAAAHLKNIVANKLSLEECLSRQVSIHTAAIDYFSLRGMADFFPVAQKPHKQPAAPDSSEDEWYNRICHPTYHLERTKEEIGRAKRYNTALSAILVDPDHLHTINETLGVTKGDEALKLIIRIIQKTIRTVDIIARNYQDRFIVILPNTNLREAIELAERIRKNVLTRTAKALNTAAGISLTASVCQCNKDEKAPDFIKRIESILALGKQKKRNSVYGQ